VQAATAAEALPAKNEDTTVLVAGPTGYIGRYVTKELISRGYKARPCSPCAPDGRADGASLPQVIAFSREKAGVGGKKSKDDVERDFAGAYKVVFGDVTVRAIVAASGRTCADAARRRAWTRCARLRSRRRWTSSCRASPAAPEGSRCAQPAGASCADC
jgi:hypothetical protein